MVGEVSVIEALKDEHRVIERVLKVLEACAQRIERGGDVPVQSLEKILDFIRTFADKCHLGKEEESLFPILEERGIPRDGPIGVMLTEHDVGRRFVRAMSEGLQGYQGGDEAASGVIAENMRGYIRLLTEHIFKEDNILYPMAEQVLSQDDQKVLREKFEDVEKGVGERVHQEYLRLVERLQSEFGV